VPPPTTATPTRRARGVHRLAKETGESSFFSVRSSLATEGLDRRPATPEESPYVQLGPRSPSSNRGGFDLWVRGQEVAPSADGRSRTPIGDWPSLVPMGCFWTSRCPSVARRPSDPRFTEDARRRRRSQGVPTLVWSRCRAVLGATPRSRSGSRVAGQRLATVVGDHVGERGRSVERDTPRIATFLRVGAIQVANDPFAVEEIGELAQVGV
jgi:hypothetical protein